MTSSIRILSEGAFQYGKWEYKSEITRAHIDAPGAREYLARKYPGWKPSKFFPELIEARLDSLGADGWELVHMEPIEGAGDNMDVYYAGGTGGYHYSNAYFCVFKRRKAE